MFKKSDILPLTLAFASTSLIVVLGFIWLSTSNVLGFGDENEAGSLEANADNLTENSLASDNSDPSFYVPSIVPQGTSVTINGSNKLNQVNQILRRSFHREFPGTVVSTGSDGTQAGLNLLNLGKIDIAAIDRPLEQVEQAAGLSAVKILESVPVIAGELEQDWYYVYREPLDLGVEAFLGYVLSPEGQLAINSQ